MNGQTLFDAIVFDLGGVLIRYRPRPRILDWIQDRLTLAELWRWWLASELVRDFETGRISSDTFATGIIREFKLTVSKEEYLASFAESHEAVYEGVPELLQRLARRYVTGALSNTNETLWKRCEALGILAHFRHLFPSHRIGFVKPDPRIYRHVLGVLGIPAGRVLYFDDSRENVAAARTLGIQAFQALGIRDVFLRLAELGIDRD
jgi:putative hydrolase of the HAD superfamily